MVIVQRDRQALVPLPQRTRGWPWTSSSRLPRRWRKRQDWPRITVVTPSFNQGPFLEQTLRSVLLQGYPNLEYIVVDGASDDGSIDILKHYHPHLSYWVSEWDRGQAHAINKGLRRATGDILGWLNSDDLLLPGSLFHIAESFLRDPSPRAVTGLRKVVDGEGRHLRNWVRDLPLPRYLQRYCCVAQETTYWHREIFETLGLLDESFHYALDYEYWLRLLEQGFDFELLPKYLGVFREHPTSKTTTQDAVFQRESKRLYRRYGLGRNQEDVLSQLGELWNWRRALIEDLCKTHFLDHPGVAVLLLRWLEKPENSARAVSLYRRFRLHHPRFRWQVGRWRALARSVIEEYRGEPIFDDHEPHLFPANPVARPRLTWEEAKEQGVTGWPVDGLAVGAGWSWVEKTKALSYRWADNDAEILITHPSGCRRRLLLRLETGPSLDWQSFDLQVIDESDQVVAHRDVQPQEDWTLVLNLDSASLFRCFRLRVESRGKLASEEDPRVLNFRLIGLGWEEDAELFDLPTHERTLQVALDKPDIVSSQAIDHLVERRLRRGMPESGLLLGKGWLALESDDRGRCSRRACGDCEIVVCGRSGAEVEMEIEAAFDASLGDRNAASMLTVLDEAGRELKKVEVRDLGAREPQQSEVGGQRVLRVKLPVDAAMFVFRLHVHAPEEISKPRGWRVYSILLC